VGEEKIEIAGVSDLWSKEGEKKENLRKDRNTILRPLGELKAADLEKGGESEARSGRRADIGRKIL